MESPRIIGTGHGVSIPELGQQKRTARRIEAAAGLGVTLAAERGVGLAGLRASQDTCDEGAEGKDAHRLRYCTGHIGGFVAFVNDSDRFVGEERLGTIGIEGWLAHGSIYVFSFPIVHVTKRLTATWPALRTINIERCRQHHMFW